MLGITRRRVLSGLSASVIAGALVLSVAPPVSATPVVVAPLIPEVAATVAEGCAATGPGCAIVGAAALAYGAWWAYTNRDQLLPWLDQTVGAGGSTNAPGPASQWQWADVHSPSAGPVASPLPNGNGPFALQCVGNYPCPDSTFTVRCILGDGTVHSVQGSIGGTYAGMGTGSIGHTCDGQSVAELTVIGNGSGGQVLYWKADGSWDSTRTTTTTIGCTVPGGATSYYTVTSTTAGVTENRTTTIPNCSGQGAPAGAYTSSVVVKDGTGLAGTAVVPRIDWKVKSGTEATYPNCFTGSSPGFGACALAVTWNGTACDTTVSQCVDWFTQSSFSSTGYGCKWGPYDVPLANCDVLKYSYQPGTTIDPTTGLPVPVQTATPAPSTTAGGGAQPTTGTNPLPQPSASASGWVSAQPFPQPTGTATPIPEPPAVIGPTPGQSNCMDAAWGWNPVNWVVVPVECALTWAFVPDGAVMQQTVSDMGNHWHASATGTFVDGAFGMFATLGNLTAGDAQACGLVVNFPYAQGHSQEIRLLDSCTAPMSTYAPWVKGFLTAMLLFDGIYACVRALGIGFGIGVPPKMGQLDLFSQN